MDIQENIQSRFDKKYNCCQVVLTYVAAKLGFDEACALKMAATFGGGMGKGDTCGCVTGAYMALGLQYGNGLDDEAKKTLMAQKAAFEQKFLALNKSLYCRDLLGLDFSEPAEKEEIMQSGILKKECPRLAREAAQILDEIL